MNPTLPRVHGFDRPGSAHTAMRKFRPIMATFRAQLKPNPDGSRRYPESLYAAWERVETQYAALVEHVKTLPKEATADDIHPQYCDLMQAFGAVLDHVHGLTREAVERGRGQILGSGSRHSFSRPETRNGG